MAIIGSPGVDFGTVLLETGAAYDFRRDPDTGLFSERTQLIASDAAADEAFGTAVSVACDTIIIGAPDVDLDSLLLDAGAAFVFQTFEEQDDSDDGDDGGGSSGLSCFIGTAGTHVHINGLGYLLAALMTIALIVLKQVRRKRSQISEDRCLTTEDRCQNTEKTD
jgi:hypothetical protein